MRFDTPAPESPSTGEIGDLPPTGESTPPPALLPTAQRDQVHNAAGAYIGTHEKDGRAIDEATASHMYSTPLTIPITHHPPGYQLPMPPPHLVDKTPSPPPPPGFTP